MSTEFIRDVIYHLKQEYGLSAVLSKRTEVLNILTGVKAPTNTSKTIQNVIALPTDRRNAFLKSVGIHQEAYVELDRKQFLVDADDVLDFGPEIDDFFSCDGNQYTVKHVETFPFAFIVTTSNALE